MKEPAATTRGRDESAHAASVRAAADHLTALLQSEPHRLRRRSISLGVPVDDADDAAQNVALRAWRSLAGLHSVEAGPLCAWLDSIARTTAIDMNRQRKDDLGEVMCDRLESGQDVEANTELRAQLSEALTSVSKLSDELRTPLVMSVVDELPATEIADRLGLTAVAVRQRISRARRALRSDSETR